MGRSAWSSGRVVLGCGSFGGIGGARDLIGRGLDDDASLATLDEAAALGITMLDTAERYAGGASERVIGRWLAERAGSLPGPVQITTKVAPASMSDGDAAFDLAFIEPIFEGSLERLGVDRVDWLLIHAPDDDTPVERTLEALASIHESGRCGHIGACNLDARQLSDAVETAERMGVGGYELVQNGYSLLQPDGEAEVRRLCHEHHVAFTAYSPLAGGVLTGKYHPDERPPEGTRLDLRPDGFDALLTRAVYDAIGVLAQEAAARDVSTGAVALAWLLSHEGVTASIMGPARSAPYLGIAAEALRIDLDDETREALADAFRVAARG
jgi:aryl-alcohol dehydrogenase-like predicted oxidoreductase